MDGGFTKRISVYDGMPYGGFNDLELLVVEKALRLVWAEAGKRTHCHNIDFRKANEDQISSALCLVFDNIWAYDRTLLSDLATLFQAVPEFNSQHGAVDYLGRALKFRPDFTFRRIYTPPGMSVLNGCLFIEAKVIDPGRTMGTYCGDGLLRFVDGTYAWAVPQAMMFGYVHQTNQQLPNSLADHLQRRGKRETYKFMGGPTAFSPSRFSNRSYTTLHDRDWTYPGTTRPAGPIKVLHLWLQVT